MLNRYDILTTFKLLRCKHTSYGKKMDRFFTYPEDKQNEILNNLVACEIPDEFALIRRMI